MACVDRALDHHPSITEVRRQLDGAYGHLADVAWQAAEADDNPFGRSKTHGIWSARATRTRGWSASEGPSRPLARRASNIGHNADLIARDTGLAYF